MSLRVPALNGAAAGPGVRAAAAQSRRTLRVGFLHKTALPERMVPPPPASPMGTLALVTLHVHDIHRAVAFYRDTLGLPASEPIDVPGLGWAEIEVGPGLKLGLHEDKDGSEEGSRPPGGATGFYFHVPDVDASVRELRARGVKVVDEPEDKPYGRDAVIQDPDGHLLGLMTPS